MTVYFNEYDTEKNKKCNKDYISVSGIKIKKKTKNLKICGKAKKKKYTTAKKSTTIKFTSNSKTTKKGFKAKITSG